MLEPKSISSILSSKFSKGSLGRQVKASLMVEFANEKLKEFWGKAGAGQAKAISIKNFILTISCQNSIIAQEVNFKKTKLVDLINEKFGSTCVKKVKIVQRGVEKQPEC